MKYCGRELRRQHDGDAGYDLSAAHMVEIPPMSSALVRTGTSVEIPAGHVGLVRGRSGLALTSVLAFEGTIDSGYRGEIKVLMINMGHLPAIIHTGYRIAQLVVVPCLMEDAERVDDLPEGDRGDDGFGSTGR